MQSMPYRPSISAMTGQPTASSCQWLALETAPPTSGAQGSRKTVLEDGFREKNRVGDIPFEG
jgi:hypothetical protein